jgi:aconitate hydratase
MMRGTFANIRLRNRIGGPGAAADGGGPLPEGGFTRHFGPAGVEQMSIYDAAMRYGEEGVELVVLAGQEYGTGSSRDWAAKGTKLLGVRAVIAESFERIHRSNLVGMGVLPLQFSPGDSAAKLGLSGEEVFSIGGVREALETVAAGGTAEVLVWARRDGDGDAPGGEDVTFRARVRIDTPREGEYFRHGGILQYVLRTLLAK